MLVGVGGEIKKIEGGGVGLASCHAFSQYQVRFYSERKIKKKGEKTPRNALTDEGAWASLRAEGEVKGRSK